MENIAYRLVMNQLTCLTSTTHYWPTVKELYLEQTLSCLRPKLALLRIKKNVVWLNSFPVSGTAFVTQAECELSFFSFLYSFYPFLTLTHFEFNMI